MSLAQIASLSCRLPRHSCMVHLRTTARQLHGMVVSLQSTTFVQSSICLGVMQATFSLQVMRAIRLTCMSRLEKLTPSIKPIRLIGTILLDLLSSQMVHMEKHGAHENAKSLMVIALAK